ncbi:MAG TPA: PAS domain-containing sensor histidine kinase [Usitatibacter sp.]|jgi:PAS domain S-box-containing protein|nr:PAS domain-containing sensor histidine kinase [Usitatibacter sp.]
MPNTHSQKPGPCPRRDASASSVPEHGNAWLAAIVESSDDAIVSKDLDGVVTSWNPAAERIFGYTAEEMIGQSIARIIPPGQLEEEKLILSRVRSGQRIEHFQTVRRRKDGTHVYLSISVSPVRDACGKIIGASKIARDITSQHDGERIRGLLAAIVESSDDAIISKDLNGTITSWNHAAQRLYGYAPEEIIGQSVMKIVPPDLYDEEHRILAKVREGNRIEHFETTRVAKDGRRIEVSITVSPVRSSSGAIIGASKMARDLTSLREADRTRATLAAIVTGSDDAIISKTLRGIISSWNPAAERLYGFRTEEMVGQSIMKIIPPHLQHEEEEILAKIRAGERIDHFETVRQRKDGTLIEVSLTVSPLRDSLGRVVGASKIARDITAQREAQRRKDEFLAVLAHELRNPLAPIRNAIALFAQPGLTAEQRGRAHAIADRQLAHMSRLLDDLLDVSRLTRGHVELKRSRVELHTLVQQAVEATRGSYEDRRHKLVVREAGEPIWLLADAVRITQILANLLTNAAKYTDAGGEVEIATRRAGDEAVITVSDNGIGFDRDMQRRLFVLFSQDKAAMGRAAGGMGIGLALVREFVERHGGTVTGESGGPGKGSRFTVRIPCLEAGA